MSEGRQKRWFHLSVRNILLAQFWLAVFFGCIAYAMHRSPATGPPGDLENLVVFFGTTLVPFIACGSLFGHPWRGLATGLVVLGILVVCLLPFLPL